MKQRRKNTRSKPVKSNKLALRPNVEVMPTPTSGGASVIARLVDLASNPRVDVAKIEKLIDANERFIAIGAKAAFALAYAQMQALIPVIKKDGRIEVKKEGYERSTPFATNANIQKVCRPIMARYGFAIRFRHEFNAGLLKVIGILSHEAGHSEQDEFETSRDDSPGKNTIQSWGSARSYGQRYVTRALLNIADESEDDDGHAAGAGSQKPAAAAYHSPQSGEFISEKQVGRFWVIAKKFGWTEADVRELTKPLDSVTKIKRLNYDDICAALEAGPRRS